MSTNRDSFTLIYDTFLKAIDVLASSYSGSSLTDIFIIVEKESGEVSFYDDEENQVADIVVFDWINRVDDLSDEAIVIVLKDVVARLDKENKFSALDVYKPFSVNYADENFTVLEELLLINEDSIINLDDDLMEKFGKEFDDFLDKLLKE